MLFIDIILYVYKYMLMKLKEKQYINSIYMIHWTSYVLGKILKKERM